MDRFGLSDIVAPPRHLETNEVPQHKVPTNFRDKRLNKLWKKAKMAGFTGNVVQIGSYVT